MPTLDQMPVRAQIEIKTITDPETAMATLRMGIAEGERFQVVSKVPGDGPLVLQRIGMQGGVEIALGRTLCRQIDVECFS